MGTIAVKWVDSRLMIGVDSLGHSMVISSWPEKEPVWFGLKPSDLLLISAASCSAYDVVMILEKQREPLEGLEVTCTGEQMEDPPYKFTKIHLHYAVKGHCNVEKVARAIRLSEEKYCSVINTLKTAVEMTSDFEILAS
jgi:putative redox protein